MKTEKSIVKSKKGSKVSQSENTHGGGNQYFTYQLKKRQLLIEEKMVIMAIQLELGM